MLNNSELIQSWCKQLCLARLNGSDLLPNLLTSGASSAGNAQATGDDPSLGWWVIALGVVFLIFTWVFRRATSNSYDPGGRDEEARGKLPWVVAVGVFQVLLGLCAVTFPPVLSWLTFYMNIAGTIESVKDVVTSVFSYGMFLLVIIVLVKQFIIDQDRDNLSLILVLLGMLIVSVFAVSFNGGFDQVYIKPIRDLFHLIGGGQ
jgi:hypothetical protein